MNKNNQGINAFFEIRCKNVHLSALEKGPILTEGDSIEEIFGVGKQVDYEYWHYLCDGFDDRGWGCGYRTLQTIASWIKMHFSQESLPKVEHIHKYQVNRQKYLQQ